MATTVIPIHSSDSHGGDVPWQYVVGYGTVGLIGWLFTAVLVLRHEQATKDKPIDAEDKIFAVLAGTVTAFGWPLVIAGFGIWKIVERFIRQPVSMAKRDR